MKTIVALEQFRKTNHWPTFYFIKTSSSPTKLFILLTFKQTYNSRKHVSTKTLHINFKKELHVTF